MLFRLLGKLLRPSDLFEVNFPVPECTLSEHSSSVPEKVPVAPKPTEPQTEGTAMVATTIPSLVLSRATVKIFQDTHYVDSNRPGFSLCGQRIFKNDKREKVVQDGKVVQVDCKQCHNKLKYYGGLVKIARVKKKEKEKKEKRTGLGRIGSKKEKPPLNDGISNIKHLGPSSQEP